MYETVQAQLHELGAQFQWHDVVGSTNVVALEQARGGGVGDAPLLVAADVQTAGRGRRDRTWHAPPGTSVLCSLVLRPSLPKPLWPRFSLVAGLALDQVVCQHVRAQRVGLKWPNDVQVDGLKAAGILLETGGDVVVVGLGLNVDWRGIERPEGLSATSLSEAADADIDRDQTIVDVARALLGWVDRAQQDPDGIVQAYIPRCVTIGAEVAVHGLTGRSAPLVGTGVGLTPDGHLRVRPPDGPEVVVSAGDVEHVR